MAVFASRARHLVRHPPERQRQDFVGQDRTHGAPVDAR
jgi:hypothetical protein